MLLFLAALSGLRQLSFVVEFCHCRLTRLGLIVHRPMPRSRLLVSRHTTVPSAENSYSQTQSLTQTVHFPSSSCLSSGMATLLKRSSRSGAEAMHDR